MGIRRQEVHCCDICGRELTQPPDEKGRKLLPPGWVLLKAQGTVSATKESVFLGVVDEFLACDQDAAALPPGLLEQLKKDPREVQL